MLKLYNINNHTFELLFIYLIFFYVILDIPDHGATSPSSNVEDSWANFTSMSGSAAAADPQSIQTDTKNFHYDAGATGITEDDLKHDKINSERVNVPPPPPKVTSKPPKSKPIHRVKPIQRPKPLGHFNQQVRNLDEILLVIFCWQRKVWCYYKIVSFSWIYSR